jgi:hypothetical protein
MYQLLHALGNSALGRRTLVDQTGITEMTVRTHLNRLRDMGWVSMEKAGTQLTDPAKERLDPLFEQVISLKELKVSKQLAVEAFNSAALVRGCKRSMKKSLYLRDTAVRAGAAGAIFLFREGSDWKFIEDASSFREQNPKDAEVLQQVFQPEDEDVLIMSFASNLRFARAGLWSVIAEMIPIEIF